MDWMRPWPHNWPCPKLPYACTHLHIVDKAPVGGHVQRHHQQGHHALGARDALRDQDAVQRPAHR